MFMDYANFLITQYGFVIAQLAPSPLDPSRRTLDIIHMLQADMLQTDISATPRSQPVCVCIHGTGTVTHIPDQPYDLYTYRYFNIFGQR